MFTIVPAEPAGHDELKKLVCPACREKVPRVGISKDSKIQGLSFECRRCGKLWAIKTE